MTANELANLLEVDSWYKLVTKEEIATMLRQQQAEIEALKQSKSDGNNKVNSELTDEELGGWITAWAKDLCGTLYFEPTDRQRTMAIKMARAILRKAQEK